MTFPGATAYLQSFINHEFTLPSRISRNTFKIDRVHELLRLLGDPQKKFICLHIAGSKGKGSTSVIAATILASAGYKVGLYSSPHLSDYKERIRVLTPSSLGKARQTFLGQASERELSECLKIMRPAIEQVLRRKELGRLTYFEVLTALAFFYFSRRKIEVAVLETGLGGRLDATNVVEAAVSAITPISLEHTQILGKTLGLIAAEKAGIIKGKEGAVILAPQPAAARKVLVARCRTFGLRPIEVGKAIRVRIERQTLHGLEFSIQTRREHYRDLKISLLGKHQAENAAVAVAMLEALQVQGIKVSAAAVRRGLARAVWPARFELVRRVPTVILDGAHNGLSCQKLKETFVKIFPQRKAILIWGVSEDKDRKVMARILRGISKIVIGTQADHPRAVRFTKEELAESFPGCWIQLTRDCRSALAAALKISRDEDVILAAGSLFVAGEVRKLCIS